MAITDAKTALTTAQSRLSGASTDAAMLAAYQAVQTAASNLINVLSENGGSAADRGSAIQTLNDAAAEIGRLERAIAAAEKDNAAAIAKLLAALDLLTVSRRESNDGYPPGGPHFTTALTATNPTSAPSRVKFEPTYGAPTRVSVNTAASVTAARNKPNTNLAKAMGQTMAGKNGWTGTMVSATDDAGTTTDTALVYTNIEAPKSVAFGDIYTLDSTGRFNVATSASAGDSKIQADDFFTGNAAQAHGIEGTPSEVISFKGSYAGAGGVYRCVEATDGSCTSQGTSKGIQLGGTWSFEPSPGAMATQTDDTYSFFGWWLREGSDGKYYPAVYNGNIHTKMDTILNPPEPDGIGVDIQIFLTGTATYTGLAVGKYAIAGFPNAGGHFTADASLTVDFLDRSGIGNVKGEITNFMAGGTELPWRVDFAESLFSGQGEFNDADRAIATWTIDGIASETPQTSAGGVSVTNIGRYTGHFGSNPDDTVPTSATGTWQVPYVTANSTEAFGHMIGAFGVTKDD